MSDEPGGKKTFDEVWGSSEKDVMVEGGEGGDSSREGSASAAASGSARVPVPGTAEGEMSLQEISSEDVPFVPGEGSEFQKMAHQTSLSKFDLAPLPAPLKSMAFHLKLPYILAIVSTVFSVCAISLGIASYFYPFQYTNATTTWIFFQSITVELGMITAKYIYTCAPVDVRGADCVTSPLTFTGLYPRFFAFWYREINSSGFSPYDNTPVPTSDPALASLCLCALAMGFALASIVVTSANAAAMKREILDLPPYDKSMLVFKGCRYCPPPGHTYTVQRGVLFNSLALAAQLMGAGITWIYIPVYNQQLMGLSALNYITNGNLPTLTLGPGTYLAGASIGCYAVSLACTVYSKFHLRKAARMDKGRKYPLNAMLGSTETQHWCC